MFFTENFKLCIHYDSKSDLLYLRLEPLIQEVFNKRVTEDMVLDIGADDKIIGIEIMEASKHVNLEALIPIEYKKTV